MSLKEIHSFTQQIGTEGLLGSRHGCRFQGYEEGEGDEESRAQDLRVVQGQGQHWRVNPSLNFVPYMPRFTLVPALLSAGDTAMNKTDRDRRTRVNSSPRVFVGLCMLPVLKSFWFVKAKLPVSTVKSYAGLSLPLPALPPPAFCLG